MFLNNIAAFLLRMPRGVKRLMVVLVDVSFCWLATWLAFVLRLEAWVSFDVNMLIASSISMAIALPLFIVFGLYRAIFRYSGLDALTAIFKSLLIYTFIIFTTLTLVGLAGIPRTIGIIQPALLAMFVLTSRATARYWLGGLYRRLSRADARRLLVYGAGAAGRQLSSAIGNSAELILVGYLDDDKRLHGQILSGVKIYCPSRLDEIVNELNVHDILLAMPSASRARRNEILECVRKLRVQVRTLPGLDDLAQGNVHFSDLRELDIEDLLGRDTVSPNKALLSKNIDGKVVLVTGAGGSIGSELCRQVIRLKPKSLILIDHSEFALYSIHNELLGKCNLINSTCQLVPLLANVQDEKRIAEILNLWKPLTIYHAAAYKHVPLVEQNAGQGILNNVYGTLNLALQAINYHVADFVLISTDKAVRPTNIMGASKRLAEMVLQALASRASGVQNHTRFSMVRFGNVLGSSGSVVPLFREQIKAGRAITLTHPEITRYFMTIPEAAELVIQAGAMAQGGDVFILDMGESIKIIDLARRMIELSGLTVRDEKNPGGDIPIEITGLRPGEKLYEELLIGSDPKPTIHPRIMKAQESFIIWDVFVQDLKKLASAIEENRSDRIREILQDLVEGYQPEVRSFHIAL